MKYQIIQICSQFPTLSFFVSTCWWQQENNKENAYHFKSLPVRELYNKSAQEIHRKQASPLDLSDYNEIQDPRSISQ